MNAPLNQLHDGVWQATARKEYATAFRSIARALHAAAEYNEQQGCDDDDYRVERLHYSGYVVRIDDYEPNSGPVRYIRSALD